MTSSPAWPSAARSESSCTGGSCLASATRRSRGWRGGAGAGPRPCNACNGSSPRRPGRPRPSPPGGWSRSAATQRFQPHTVGVLVIDATGDRKDGTKTAYVAHQDLGAVGRIANGIVSVTSPLANEDVYYSLHVVPYAPAKRLPKGKTTLPPAPSHSWRSNSSMRPSRRASPSGPWSPTASTVSTRRSRQTWCPKVDPPAPRHRWAGAGPVTGPRPGGVSATTQVRGAIRRLAERQRLHAELARAPGGRPGPPVRCTALIATLGRDRPPKCTGGFSPRIVRPWHEAARRCVPLPP